jgi:hypothetical protein
MQSSLTLQDELTLDFLTDVLARMVAEDLNHADDDPDQEHTRDRNEEHTYQW